MHWLRLSSASVVSGSIGGELNLFGGANLKVSIGGTALSAGINGSVTAEYDAKNNSIRIGIGAGIASLVGLKADVELNINLNDF